MSKKEVPSEIFLKAFALGLGSIRGKCECCGRECYQSYERGFFDEGELEELERQAKKEPDKYSDFQDCTVSFGEVDGKQFVFGCPCEMKALFKYELFVWTHRRGIVRYLTDITKERKRIADENHAEATSVENAVRDAFKREEDYGRKMECRGMIERLTKLVDNARWSDSDKKKVLQEIESISSELRKKSFEEGEKEKP